MNTLNDMILRQKKVGSIFVIFVMIKENSARRNENNLKSKYY